MAKIYFDDIKLIAIRNKLFSCLIHESQANLFDVIALSSGDYLPTQKLIIGDYEVYGGGGLTDKTHNAFNVEFETFGIGRVGARCGCVFKINPQSWVTDNALFARKIDASFDIEFLIHFLNFKNINQYANTAAQPVISLKRISSITIPKIDLKRQKEIVDILNKIENGILEFDNDPYEIQGTFNFISSSESLSTELTHQLTLVKKLRQQLLQDAVQGKLVAQDLGDEPAGELLKRIKKKKELLIKQKKLKIGKLSEQAISLIEEAIIPNNWQRCKSDDIFFVTKLAGFEYTDHISLKTTGEVPVVRAQNVRPLNIDKTNLLYIDLYVSKLLERCALTKKCLLVTFIGAGIGDVATFDEKSRWHLAPNVAKMEPFEGCEEYINVKFLNYYLMSKIGQREIFKHMKATAQPSLSMGTIRDIDFVLPPLNEQCRIVQKLEELMGMCVGLEASIRESMKQNERLLQQVLREALRGEEKEKEILTTT